MELTARQTRFLQRVSDRIEAEPVNTPGIPEVARDLGVPVQAVQEIVRIGWERGQILSLDGLLFTPAQIERIQARVRQLSGSEPLMPKKLREELGTSRRYLDALLRHFDRVGFTVATESGRVLLGP